MVLHGSTAIRQYRQQQERHRKQVSTARILKPLRQLAGDVGRRGLQAKTGTGLEPNSRRRAGSDRSQRTGIVSDHSQIFVEMVAESNEPPNRADTT
jgi:hypothetical protein